MEQVEFAPATIDARNRYFRYPLSLALHMIEQCLRVEGVPVDAVQERPYACRTIGLGADRIVQKGHIKQQICAENEELARQNPKVFSLLGAVLL